jgi:hypothetical protein
VQNQKNLSNIDEMYVADSMDWDYLKKSLDEKKVRYLITAPILCSLTGNENINLDDIIEICQTNAEKIISKYEPKKLITIGQYAKVDIAGSSNDVGITQQGSVDNAANIKITGSFNTYRILQKN